MATAITRPSLPASSGLMEGSNPHAWHKRPDGQSGKRCAVCDAPASVRGEHRLTAEQNRLDRRYICRKKTPEGWMELIAGSAYGPRIARAPTGPTKKTLQSISRAAAMLADGETMRAIATDLKIAENTLYEFRSKYPEIWQRAVERAMSALAAVVEAQAGSTEILADPAAFIAKAQSVERWTEKTGRQFMPVKGGTLRSFYESYYRRACMGRVCDAEAKSFERTIRLWAILTGDPPLESITAETLATFRDCIAKLPGKSRTRRATAATVLSYMVHLQRILDKAGPPMKGNRDAAGILASVSWIRPPRVHLREPKIVSAETLNQLYLGLVAAEKPRGFWFRPSAWWRALIVLALNTGLRRGTLFRIEMRHVDWEKRRLLIPAENNKSGKPFSVHLNEAAFNHLWKIRSDRDFLFSWPHHVRHFHAYFHKLQDAAGIQRADHFGLHNLRKTLATMLYEQSSPGAAQLALGHSAVSTTERHYVASSGIVAKALDALPQPAAFAEGAAL